MGNKIIIVTKTLVHHEWCFCCGSLHRTVRRGVTIVTDPAAAAATGVVGRVGLRRVAGITSSGRGIDHFHPLIQGLMGHGAATGRRLPHRHYGGTITSVHGLQHGLETAPRRHHRGHRRTRTPTIRRRIFRRGRGDGDGRIRR